MKIPRSSMLCAVALTGSLAACYPNIHDNTINISADIDVTTSIDVNAVKPGQTIPCTAKVTNVYLVDPATTPPAEHVADAGHLRYYLDDDTAAPLLITAQLTASVKIPVEAKAGDHKILCRFHKHDGTPTNVMFEMKITVTVAVGGGGDAG